MVYTCLHILEDPFGCDYPVVTDAEPQHISQEHRLWVKLTPPLLLSTLLPEVRWHLWICLFVCVGETWAVSLTFGSQVRLQPLTGGLLIVLAVGMLLRSPTSRLRTLVSSPSPRSCSKKRVIDTKMLVNQARVQLSWKIWSTLVKLPSFSLSLFLHSFLPPRSLLPSCPAPNSHLC